MTTQKSPPHLTSYQRHVFVCTGSRCAPDTNQEIYKELKAELKELKVDQVTVRRSQASCFGICEGGPILVVYPEGTWYHHVTRGKLKTIINEHLLKGKIIKEWTIPVFPPPNATS